MESLVPHHTAEIAEARAVLNMAETFYQKAHRAYQEGRARHAAEYAVAVKDLMRAVDKIYNIVMMP
ncbi:MAG: hypothetical protein GXO56_06365 [Chloroflexi bacterium]|nr:hypothetical protein [Chloroflexota bacterium]